MVNYVIESIAVGLYSLFILKECRGSYPIDWILPLQNGIMNNNEAAATTKNLRNSFETGVVSNMDVVVVPRFLEQLSLNFSCPGGRRRRPTSDRRSLVSRPTESNFERHSNTQEMKTEPTPTATATATATAALESNAAKLYLP